MGLNKRILWIVLVCTCLRRHCIAGESETNKEVMKRVMKPCEHTVQSTSQEGPNGTTTVRIPVCDPGGSLIEKTAPKKLDPTVAAKQAVEDSPETDIADTHVPEDSIEPVAHNEDLSGGKTGLASEEKLLHSEGEEEEEEEEGGDGEIDSLAPHVPFPEMGAGSEVPATSETTLDKSEQDVAANNHLPNEKKSELFINSGIFPFIAMGVLSTLFITMMIAALYFARHPAGVGQSQMSAKVTGFGRNEVMRGEPTPFNSVVFRNSKDAVMGDFAINMFAVRQEEREEAKRELTERSDVKHLEATRANVPASIAAPETHHWTSEDPAGTVLYRDLPDVVSTPSSRRETMNNNRHSTGSSLYMELMNMCRNTQLIQELALRKKHIRIQDASRVEKDCMFPELFGTHSRSGKPLLMRQASLDSSPCRESVPLPSTYESHYYKLYDGDDDDDSSTLGASASANTTMDTALFSGDEGCTSTLSSLHRKGSSKRSSRLIDETKFLLPVQEFFDATLITGGSEGEQGEVLYETIDEMGYRRRTASSRALRRLMEARESTGTNKEIAVMENAWESSPKKYDKLDRSSKAFKKHGSTDTDYNTLKV